MDIYTDSAKTWISQMTFVNRIFSFQDSIEQTISFNAKFFTVNNVLY